MHGHWTCGANLQISAPLGQYDENKLVNLGNNRWFVKPDIGISKAWGELTAELSTGVFFSAATIISMAAANSNRTPYPPSSYTSRTISVMAYGLH